MLFAVLALHVNNQLENVFVNHILLETQTICACHRLQIQFVNRNVVKMRIVAMDLYQMNVSAIRTRSEIHTKFVVQLKETHVRIQSVELERSVVKQMVVSNVFAQSVTPAIHLLNVAIWMNVWRTRAEQIRFVLTLPVATIANVNVAFSEIHSQCAVQFRVISNVMIQIAVFAAIQLLAQLGIDVKVANV